MPLELVGRRFNRLRVVSLVRPTPHGRLWLCECSCGEKKIANGSHLTQGGIQSCGCLHRETARKTGRANRTHGLKNTPTWSTWRAMKKRCLEKSARGYQRYGGRGIAICERWVSSFENFLADMGERPSRKHSIDRINSDGNYEPGNCRWADYKQQAANRRPPRRNA